MLLSQFLDWGFSLSLVFFLGLVAMEIFVTVFKGLKECLQTQPCDDIRFRRSRSPPGPRIRRAMCKCSIIVFLIRMPDVDVK